MDPDEEDEVAGDPDDPDDPDLWADEAEDKETTDNERDDHDGVPVVDGAPDNASLDDDG